MLLARIAHLLWGISCIARLPPSCVFFQKGFPPKSRRRFNNIINIVMMCVHMVAVVMCVHITWLCRAVVHTSSISTVLVLSSFYAATFSFGCLEIPLNCEGCFCFRVFRFRGEGGLYSQVSKAVFLKRQCLNAARNLDVWASERCFVCCFLCLPAVMRGRTQPQCASRSSASYWLTEVWSASGASQCFLFHLSA